MLSLEWFGKLSVTLKSVLVDLYLWLKGDLLLRLGTTISKVMWNFLGL
jgi:hypothetical protein